MRFTSRNISVLLIVAISLLSAFTHLYNAIGFPDGPSNDESIYMRRAMHVLTGQGPQEGTLYDHPYFGQLFLAASLGLIGYPYSINASIDNAHSIEMLYLVPRILMGILAVIDTLLIYKITDIRYGRRVAVIASILFAVMPLTWLVRRMWLEPIQLPFLLSSILFAICIRKTHANESENSITNRKTLMILFSGVFLGLSIYTKIPVFAMVPLIGYVVYRNSHSLRHLGLWFVPVVLIPLIWPLYAIHIGQFNLWLDGVFWQTHRGVSNTFIDSIKYDFGIDPVLIILGISGLAFAAIKRDIFLLLWSVPFSVFLYAVGFVSYWHWIALLPAACISSAKIIEYIVKIVTKSVTKNNKIKSNLLYAAFVLVFGVFGLTSTVILINTDFNSSYYQAAAFIVRFLEYYNSIDGSRNSITVISNPFYTWIPLYVSHLNHNYYIDYYDGKISIKTRIVLLIQDQSLVSLLRNHQAAYKILNLYDTYNKYVIATFGKISHKYDQVLFLIFNLNQENKKRLVHPLVIDALLNIKINELRSNY